MAPTTATSKFTIETVLPPFLPVPVTVDLRGSSWVRRCRKPRTCSAGPGWPVLGFVEPTRTTIYGQVSE